MLDMSNSEGSLLCYSKSYDISESCLEQNGRKTKMALKYGSQDDTKALRAALLLRFGTLSCCLVKRMGSEFHLSLDIQM